MKKSADSSDELAQLRQLAQEVLEIADTEFFPDGDVANLPAIFWAESWAQRLRPETE